MKKNSLKLIAISFAMALFTISCNEESVNMPEENYVTVQDNIYTENLIGEAFSLVAEIDALPTKAAQDCPTFVWTETNLLSINYTEGCTGSDGVERTGTINARFNLDFDNWSFGDNVTITYDNYTINGNLVEGTIIITCTNTAPKVFRITSENMLITLSNSTTLSWETTMDYTLLEGSTTPEITDDTWQIDGNTSGIGTNGKNFTRVASALIKEASCKFFVSGNLIITVDETNTYDVKFLSNCGTILINYKGIDFPLYME